MQNKQPIIRIPEPCHEDWNGMKPNDTGRFCGSCNKSVIDFTDKTDTEIHQILMEYKSQKVCGHFKVEQVNRPLNIRINLNSLPKNMSATNTFVLALFLVFGTMLFSCTNYQGNKVEKIELENSENIMGMMIAPDTPIEEETDSATIASPIAGIYSGESIGGAISYTGVGVPPQPEEFEVPEILEDTCRSGSVITGQLPGQFAELADSSLMAKADSIASAINETLNSVQTIPEVYPNPSSGEFTINYMLPKPANVSIEVFDLEGNLINTLVNNVLQQPGKQELNVKLRGLSNGVYLLSIRTANKSATKKIVLNGSN